MQERISKPAIYISYAWNPESDAIAESIEKEFGKRGVQIIRDKTNLKYKERLKDFMQEIGRGKYVILIISNKYLKSENCMYELLQIFKNQDFYERIFPVVLDDVRISKATDRLELVKYWENEADNLDVKIRELKKLSNIQGVTDDLNLYTEIRNNIAKLTNILKDIYYLNTERHISSDFKQLYELVQTKIKDDSSNNNVDIQANEKIVLEEDDRSNSKSSSSKRNRNVLLGFTGLLAMILVVQVISNKSFSGNEADRDKIEKRKVINGDSLINSKLKDSAKIRELKVPEKEKEFSFSHTKYDVTLVVPSSMSKADVYVDNELAEIVERGLISITVRLRKKDGSHHFEIKKGTQSCATDKLIEKDSMRFTMMCD